MAETLEQFLKKRIVNAEPVEWKGPFPDPYKSLSPDEAASFEAENERVLAKSKPGIVADKPINVATKVKEVAQPVKPEVAAVAAASPKITPEMLDQIKASMAQPSMASMYMSETLPPQAAVAPEKIDLKAIREQVQAEGPQLGLTDALLGLIPVGIDAMTGGYGGGLDVGAKYYTDTVKENEKRKQTLEDFLLKSAQARSIAGAKKSASAKLPTASNLVPVIAPDGTVKYEWAGKAAGMQKPVEMKGNTLEGKLLLQKKAQEFRNAEEDEKRKIAAGARFQQKLEQDPTFKDYKQQQIQSQRALELLSKGIGVADAGARTTFAKGIFGEVGNLAVQEQTAVSGSPAIQQKWETLWKKYTEGTLGDNDRADMVEVAAAIRAQAPKVLTKLANQKAIAETQISGQDVSSVASALSKDVTTGQVKVNVIYKGRIKSINIEDYPEAVRKYKAKLFTGKE